MERIDGFLNLDKNVENVVESTYKKGQYWLTINGETFYFKPEDNPYRELLSYHIAKRLGIEAVFYDLAIFNNQPGVVSPNYCKNAAKYIKGYDILADYFDNHFIDLMDMGFDPTISVGDKRITKLNNLEVIRLALMDKYKNISQETIDKLMYNFILQYIFCILTIQKDKTPQNWEIEELETVNLVPLNDNSLSFSNPDEAIVSLATTIEYTSVSISQSLKHFLSISSDDTINLFLEKFDILTEEELVKIIREIELSINSNIPVEEKQIVIENYRKNRENINKVLEELNISNRRR